MPVGFAVKAVCNAIARGCTTLYEMPNCDNKMTNVFWLSGMIRTSLLPLATKDISRVQGLRSVLFEPTDGKGNDCFTAANAFFCHIPSRWSSSGLGHFFVGGYLGVDNIPGQRDGMR
jgi:hypothetical protein